MPSATHRPRHKIVLIAAGALGLVLLGALVGVVMLLSGTYNTAATTQHFRLTHRLLEAGLHYSIRSYAKDIVPPPLTAPGMVERGAACYRTHCAQCHGAPGVAPAEFGKGLLPIPSSLAQSGRDWPATWLYYITKKGVRMTGMPAWEYRLSDDSLWSTVAFLQRLPLLTVDQYRELAASVAATPCPSLSDATPLFSKEEAKTVFRQYACDSCHVIDGVVGPLSYAGPPLTEWSRRKYIAGVLPNTPDNLVRWLRDPQAVSAKTLMPNLGVAEGHAREMAAYLLELE